MAQGRARWVEVRERITDAGSPATSRPSPCTRSPTSTLHLPFAVADYVDFYASRAPRANLGRLFRPDAEPLTPNWKHLPVGYHGRAGTVVVSGTDIVRPSGQRKAPDRDRADVRPEHRGWTSRPSWASSSVSVRRSGAPIPVDAFAEHVFGALLVNDWSARDLQAWEYVPLGPHLGKSFATSVVAVGGAAARAGGRARRPARPGRPAAAALPARVAAPWGLDVELAVEWNGEVVSRPPYREMYWSPAQMLAHMTVNGASARTGDLFASGTISGRREGPARSVHRADLGRPGADHRQGRGADVPARRRRGRAVRHRPGRRRRPHRLRRGPRPHRSGTVNAWSGG